MVTASGTHILKAAYNGDKEGINTTNRWHEVHQKKPDAESWRMWRRACNLTEGLVVAFMRD